MTSQTNEGGSPKEERMMKVARCKGCGAAIKMSIWPLEHPSEFLDLAIRLNNYEHYLDIHQEFDRYGIEGHAITVEPVSDVPMRCTCAKDWSGPRSGVRSEAKDGTHGNAGRRGGDR